mmetsp:Transcript_1637/g.4186  ORF Transcript_1637/g.4186 Transcript_1637/m.4186 type:complete len:122 (+) Transcript_1637:96-461(+)
MGAALVAVAVIVLAGVLVKHSWPTELREVLPRRDPKEKVGQGGCIIATAGLAVVGVYAVRAELGGAPAHFVFVGYGLVIVFAGMALIWYAVRTDVVEVPPWRFGFRTARKQQPTPASSDEA